MHRCARMRRGMMLESEPDTHDYGREDEVIRCPWHGFESNLSVCRWVIARQLKLRNGCKRWAVEDDEVALHV